MANEKRNLKKTKTAPSVVAPPLIDDLRRMIEETRQGVAATVNAGLTMLYWRVGKRINEEILKGERAEYGKEILATVSQELIRGYGNGFGEKNLRRMIQFAEVFPDEKIVVSLIRELSWTHFIALIPLEKPLQRDFYAEMCRIELLELDKSGIHVAEYLTDSLPKEVLQAKLRKAVAIARKRLENQAGKTIEDNGAALLEGD